VSKRSSLERTFQFYCRALKLPDPVTGLRFAKEAMGRKWEFDFAWPEHKVAVECEGGTWSGGRHTRGAGYAGDCEKYNAASLLGWTLIRTTTDMLNSNPQAVIGQVKQALGV